MAKILSHPCMYSFLHVPVQSGSDAVLGEMKREYTVKQFRRIVDYLKEQFSKEREERRRRRKGQLRESRRREIIIFSIPYSVPGITIATDVICGFPTETEEVT